MDYPTDLSANKITKSRSKKPKSRASSCERCKRRKQKCDHQLPTCTNCLKAKAQCVQPEKYIQHVPEKDDYTIHLENKVARLEEQVRRMHSSKVPGSSPFVDSAGETPNGSMEAGVPPHHGHGTSTPSPGNTPDSTGAAPQSTRVSILNTDSTSSGSANPPKSFSVVSSLLQDTFWGRYGKHDDESNKVSDSEGLLPDYNFDSYLKSRPVEVPDEETGKILYDYYLNILGKFSFVDNQEFKRLHDNRHIRPANLNDPTFRFNSFLLFGMYAMATVLNPPADGAKRVVDPGRLYATALCHAKLCKSSDRIWQIKALMICASFQMRTDVDEGCHFDMVNRSMKLCQEVGLHQGIGFEALSLYEQEMRKRLFWSVYGLERLYTVSTGRRFAVEDHRVSISFPVDLDDYDLTQERIQEARDLVQAEPTRLPAKVTPITFVIYLWQLRCLESDMVTNIYRADKSMEELFSKVDYYLAALRSWRDNHSLLTQREQHVAAIAYSKAVRLLLQPFLASLDPCGPLFKKCVVETGRICNVFRVFYQKTDHGFTTIAMHTNFIAGLTLIYCLWLSKDTDYLPILESIRMCTASLYLLTERSHLCRTYRDKFEDLVTATIMHVTARKQLSQDESLPEPSVEQQQQQPADIEPIPGRPSLVTADSSTSIFQNIAPQNPPPVQAYNEVKPDVDMLNQQLSQPIAGPPTSDEQTAAAAMVHVMPQQQQQQQPIVPPPPPQPQQEEIPQANRGWLNSYGYDDTMFNMINDISTWTKGTTTVGYPQDSSQQIAEHMWMNFTDFSLT